MRILHEAFALELAYPIVPKPTRSKELSEVHNKNTQSVDVKNISEMLRVKLRWRTP